MPRPTLVSSIRRRLLGYLLLPLLVVMVASIWADHRSFVTPLYDTFDRTLSHNAEGLTDHLLVAPDGRLYLQRPNRNLPPLEGAEIPPAPHFGGPPHGLPFNPGMDHRDEQGLAWFRLYPGARDSFLFRVSTPDGQTLLGEDKLPLARHADSNGFSFADTHYRGMDLRVVSYPATVANRPFVITVAEPVHHRDLVVRRLDTVIGLSDSIQLLLVLGLCLFGITFALRPLDRLREQIVQRQSHHLQPLSTDPVPTEVRPLVDSLNTLLTTVRDATLAQQHFLANAAHQLRTPLTGLKGQLDILAGEIRDDALLERIAHLRDTTDRLAHTTNQLLALARAEPTAHGPDNFVLVQLEQLIGTVVDAMLDRALAHDIDLGAECAPAPVHGVHWLLHELLANLLDNAIRHTPDGGRITLRCGVSDEAPYLEVEDNGSGIPRAERARVRERYYRSPGSLGQGSGLGLAIVDEIARGHEARFEILDTASGEGVRMRVTFPPSGQRG